MCVVAVFHTLTISVKASGRPAVEEAAWPSPLTLHAHTEVVHTTHIQQHPVAILAHCSSSARKPVGLLARSERKPVGKKSKFSCYSWAMSAVHETAVDHWTAVSL